MLDLKKFLSALETSRLTHLFSYLEGRAPGDIEELVGLLPKIYDTATGEFDAEGLKEFYRILERYFGNVHKRLHEQPKEASATEFFTTLSEIITLAKMLLDLKKETVSVLGDVDLSILNMMEKALQKGLTESLSPKLCYDALKSVTRARAESNDFYRALLLGLTLKPKDKDDRFELGDYNFSDLLPVGTRAVKRMQHDDDSSSDSDEDDTAAIPATVFDPALNLSAEEELVLIGLEATLSAASKHSREYCLEKLPRKFQPVALKLLNRVSHKPAEREAKRHIRLLGALFLNSGQITSALNVFQVRGAGGNGADLAQQWRQHCETSLRKIYERTASVEQNIMWFIAAYTADSDLSREALMDDAHAYKRVADQIIEWRSTNTPDTALDDSLDEIDIFDICVFPYLLLDGIRRMQTTPEYVFPKDLFCLAMQSSYRLSLHADAEVTFSRFLPMEISLNSDLLELIFTRTFQSNFDALMASVIHGMNAYPDREDSSELFETTQDLHEAKMLFRLFFSTEGKRLTVFDAFFDLLETRKREILLSNLEQLNAGLSEYKESLGRAGADSAAEATKLGALIAAQSALWTVASGSDEVTNNTDVALPGPAPSQ